MAPLAGSSGGGGVVTQAHAHSDHHHRHHHHQDAAQIARIWMSAPPRPHQPGAAPFPTAEETKNAAKKAQRPTQQPVSPPATAAAAADPSPTPPRAGDLPRPAPADQTPPPRALPQQTNTSADPNSALSYQQFQSPLFGQLPAELRLQVWEHALTPANNEDAAIDRPAVAASLLETCRRAYDETKLMLYERNQIRANLLHSPPPPARNGPKQQQHPAAHWTQLLSPEQQARTHLNLYVPPAAPASDTWALHLRRWTQQCGGALRPRTLQLTVWFAASAQWWRHRADELFASVRAARGIEAFVFELRVERARFAEFDKSVRRLCERRVALADGARLVHDGCEPEYREGARAAMNFAFGRREAGVRVDDRLQPRWVPCRDPERDEGSPGREMLAIVLRWEAVAAGSSAA